MSIVTPYHAKFCTYELIRQFPVNDIGKLTAAPLDAQVNFEIVDNSSNIRFDKISRIMLNLIIKKKKLKNAFIFRWRKQ